MEQDKPHRMTVTHIVHIPYCVSRLEVVDAIECDNQELYGKVGGMMDDFIINWTRRQNPDNPMDNMFWEGKRQELYRDMENIGAKVIRSVHERLINRDGTYIVQNIEE